LICKNRKCAFSLLMQETDKSRTRQGYNELAALGLD